MKMEQVRLRQNLTKAKADYDAWTSAHGVPARVDTEQDPRVQELKHQLASLEPKVREFLQ